MQRSAFESFHPWVIFGYLAAVLAVTMSTMHPVMIVTSFVISLVYSLFLCGRGVWKRSVMTGLGVAVFTMGILPLFRHNGATPLFHQRHGSDPGKHFVWWNDDIAVAGGTTMVLCME